MFAVLHIADFALHAVLRTEAGAALKPAALFQATNKKSVVLAANAAARLAGVELGMTAPQAVARCPNLMIRTSNPAAEADARAALLAVGFTLSPAIEDTAPGVCTSDLKGSTTRPEPLAAAAVAELSTLGLPATAGVARTPLLALYAARSATPAAPCAACPPPAAQAMLHGLELAEEAAPYPAGHSPVITVRDEKPFLAPLPISAADPPGELADVLGSWGLRTLGDLTALPRAEIVRRFGGAGLALWNRAAGGEPRPLHLVTLPQTFAAAMEFEQEIETLEPLLFILRRFVDRLTLELRATHQVATEAALALRLEDDTRHARNFRLPEPTADADILFRALNTHLESLRTDASICALELKLTPARPLVRQQGLFDTGLRDPHGFAETLARIAALVGSDCVGTPQREDTHRPDAVKLIAPLAIVPAAVDSTLHPPVGLPLRRFRPPLPATLEFTPAERRPSYVHTAAFAGDIVEIRGPWRGSGDWWQTDRAWSRFEWDIALANGGLYRLLLIDDAYFVEGEYD